MRRPTTVFPLLCAALLCIAGCGSDDPPPTAPTPITPVSEQIAGALTPFSVRIHSFAVDNAGAVTISLTTITPNDPVNPTRIGMDLGTALGSNVCQVTVSNTDVIQGQGVSGTATSAGMLCVRIYDVNPTGLPGEVTYLLTNEHF
jgi:hypothetical protein